MGVYGHPSKNRAGNPSNATLVVSRVVQTAEAPKEKTSHWSAAIALLLFCVIGFIVFITRNQFFSNHAGLPVHDVMIAELREMVIPEHIVIFDDAVEVQGFSCISNGVKIIIAVIRGTPCHPESRLIREYQGSSLEVIAFIWRIVREFSQSTGAFGMLRVARIIVSASLRLSWGLSSTCTALREYCFGMSGVGDFGCAVNKCDKIRSIPFFKSLNSSNNLLLGCSINETRIQGRPGGTGEL